MKITIEQCIQEVDVLEPNVCSRGEKVRWLSRIEGRVKRIMDGYENAPDFSGYTEDTPTDTALLLGEPFGDVYSQFLRAQIAAYNGENSLYNDMMTLFDDAWARFCGDYAANHRPRQTGRFRF